MIHAAHISKAEIGQPTRVYGVDHGSGGVTMWAINQRFIILKIGGASGWFSRGESKYYGAHFVVYERKPEADTETMYGVTESLGSIDFGIRQPEWS